MTMDNVKLLNLKVRQHWRPNSISINFYNMEFDAMMWNEEPLFSNDNFILTVMSYKS